MGKRSKKGSVFERQVCKELSRWWSRGKADDWFWRTAGSGGRATVRGKKGESTVNACGDIAPQCRQAEVLTNFITFELKCGYNTVSMIDALDLEAHRICLFRQWIKQALDSARFAGTPYFGLLHKRSLRHPILYVPAKLGRLIGKWWGVDFPPPLVRNCNVHVPGKSGAADVAISAFRWVDFLDMGPGRFQTIMREHEKL